MSARVRTAGRPTRANLLYVVEQSQGLFGQILSAASDRNPNRAEDIERLTRKGMAMCIAAREHDAPDAGRQWPATDR